MQILTNLSLSVASIPRYWNSDILHLAALVEYFLEARGQLHELLLGGELLLHDLGLEVHFNVVIGILEAICLTQQVFVKAASHCISS